MRKLLPSLAFLCMLLSSQVVHAEEYENPEPNIYEEIQININQNWRNELHRREEIPEEQKDLTFEAPKIPDREQIQEELFRSSMEETNTIQATAVQIGLFADGEQIARVQRDDDEVTQQRNSSSLQIILIVSIVIVLGAIFLFISRFDQTES